MKNLLTAILLFLPFSLHSLNAQIMPAQNFRNSATDAQAAHDLIARLLPKAVDHFVCKVIPKENGKDVFQIENQNGKIVISGNNAVSIASGFNYYLKNSCQCDVSWNCGDQLKLPEPLPMLDKKVRVVSPYKFRFAYNYCTFGYTMAWWQWTDWQRELDYLAMNGVNLALMINGQGLIWEKTLDQFAYANDDVQKWLVMPSHQPWMFMSNMESFGGPVPQDLINARSLLAKKILDRMRALGIQPVLQGYYGIVPPDLHKKFPQAKIHSQGDWGGGLKRPDMLDPTDPLFAKIAAAFYKAQTQLYGNVHFFAADPFHEGGSTKGINIPASGKAIYGAMQKASPGATWVLQSWQANPRQAMIDALNKNHLLVIDLNCEVTEHWRSRHNFDGTPWLWGTISNFGGNNGMAGRLSWLAKEPSVALHDPNRGRMSGIAAVPEGSQTNPVLWEMFFENAWRTDPLTTIDSWLNSYAHRRYGKAIPAADAAWKILAKTAYQKTAAQGPVNSVVCARPSLNPNQRARAYVTTTQPYDPAKLVPAWHDLIAAAPEAAASAGYRYDLADLGRQVLANLGTRYNREIIKAFKAKDKVKVKILSAKMLGLIKDMDTLAGTQREFLLGVWLDDARSWGGTPQEKNLCEWNARMLLTTWYDKAGSLNDYANREWAGLLGDFYYHRWQMWLTALNNSLAKNKPFDQNAERKKIANWELSWNHQHKHYANHPKGNVVAISETLFKKYQADASSK